MYNNNYVEFKKERDLGAIISDTFKFLRLQWKPFFGVILKNALLPLLVTIGASIFFMYKMFGLFDAFDPYSTSYQENEFSSGFFFTMMLFMALFSIITYVIMNITALYYIKSYIDNKGTVDYKMIKERVKDKFWSFTGLGILTILIVLVSAMLCFFPAFYTGVVLTLAAPILVFENRDVTDTISYSFTFFKGGHWWPTFGVMIVVGIIVNVLSYVFSMPAIIYYFIKMGTILTNDDPSLMLESFKDPIYIALNVLSYIGQFALYSVTFITNVFLYFDIDEQKNASGAIDKIDSLGA